MSMNINSVYNNFRTNYHEHLSPARKTPDSSPKQCTTNTDKVDREIKQLKEEKRLLEQRNKNGFWKSPKNNGTAKEIIHDRAGTTPKR